MTEHPSSLENQLGLTLADVAEIIKLRKEVNSHHECAIAFAERAKSSARDAISEALLAGSKLEKIKGFIRGEFKLWVKENLDFSYETAARYMRLTKVSHVTPGLDQAESLRQAYIAAGILPEKAKPVAPHAQPATQLTVTQEPTPAQEPVKFTRAPAPATEPESVTQELSKPATPAASLPEPTPAPERAPAEPVVIGAAEIENGLPVDHTNERAKLQLMTWLCERAGRSIQHQGPIHQWVVTDFDGAEIKAPTLPELAKAIYDEIPF